MSLNNTKSEHQEQNHHEIPQAEMHEKELQRLTMALEASMDGIAITDAEGNYKYVNRAYVEKFGYEDKKDLLGQSWEMTFNPVTIETLKKEVGHALNNKGSYRGETTGKRKDGDTIPLEVSTNAMEDGEFVAVVRDISPRKEKERQLQETLHNLEFAQHVARLGTWKWKVGSDEIQRSKEVYNIFEYDPEEAGNSLAAFFEVVHPEDQEKVQEAFDKIMSGEEVLNLRHRIITPKGNLKYIQLRARPYTSTEAGTTTIVGISQDITNLVKIEQRLRKSLEEKEVLLAEVHHRVKNNLAVISGLLQLEAFETTDEAAGRLLMENQMRVHAMAAIHELVYKENNFTHLAINTYLDNLLTIISRIYDSKTKNISVITDFSEVTLNLNQAVPLGLLTNEIIVNAYEHAFAEKASGEIKVCLRELNNQVILKIEDNGPGLPDIQAEQEDSFGLTLIKVLCRQLNAELTLTSDNGACYEIVFEKSENKGSISSL